MRVGSYWEKAELGGGMICGQHSRNQEGKECLNMLPVPKVCPGLSKSIIELLDTAGSLWYSHIKDYIISMIFNYKVRRK